MKKLLEPKRKVLKNNAMLSELIVRNLFSYLALKSHSVINDNSL